MELKSVFGLGLSCMNCLMGYYESMIVLVIMVIVGFLVLMSLYTTMKYRFYDPSLSFSYIHNISISFLVPYFIIWNGHLDVQLSPRLPFASTIVWFQLLYPSLCRYYFPLIHLHVLLLFLFLFLFLFCICVNIYNFGIF